jgi:hypothetical protein
MKGAVGTMVIMTRSSPHSLSGDSSSSINLSSESDSSLHSSSVTSKGRRSSSGDEDEDEDEEDEEDSDESMVVVESGVAQVTQAGQAVEAEAVCEDGKTSTTSTSHTMGEVVVVSRLN